MNKIFAEPCTTILIQFKDYNPDWREKGIWLNQKRNRPLAVFSNEEAALIAAMNFAKKNNFITRLLRLNVIFATDPILYEHVKNDKSLMSLKKRGERGVVWENSYSGELWFAQYLRIRRYKNYNTKWINQISQKSAFLYRTKEAAMFHAQRETQQLNRTSRVVQLEFGKPLKQIFVPHTTITIEEE